MLLPEYRVRARNCSTDSENTIHADDAARRYGFRGGLAPGVVVYGYAVKPVLDLYGTGWLERGGIHIKLQSPVYDGDDVVVRGTRDDAAGGLEIAVSTDVVCATAHATLGEAANRILPHLSEYPERPLPAEADRPSATARALTPGAALGTVHRTLDQSQSLVFAALGVEAGPLVHPAVLLELANQTLMQNFRLGPWLHAASEVSNWGSVRDGATVQVRSRVANCFERKGHEFVVLDLVILEAGRLVQHVIHTAIYRPKFVTAPA